MKPPQLAGHPHPRFAATDGVGIVLQGGAHAFHDRSYLVRDLTQRAHHGAGTQGQIPLIAKPIPNPLERNPLIAVQVRAARDDVRSILDRRLDPTGEGGDIPMPTAANFRRGLMFRHFPGAVRQVEDLASLAFLRRHLPEVPLALFAALDRVADDGIGIGHRLEADPHMARLGTGAATTRGSPRFSPAFGISIAGGRLGAIVAVAMQLVVQVRDLHPQRLIILQHALHQADERRDEGHDSLESAPIGRRDVLSVKVGEIYVKPFEYRWGWFDRRGFRRGCRHFQSLP